MRRGLARLLFLQSIILSLGGAEGSSAMCLPSHARSGAADDISLFERFETILQAAQVFSFYAPTINLLTAEALCQQAGIMPNEEGKLALYDMARVQLPKPSPAALVERIYTGILDTIIVLDSRRKEPMGQGFW